MKEILLADLLLPALSRESAVPLQRQIYDGIRHSVLDHHLLSGQKLPSSRALALDLGVSRITISLAYDRLIAEGYLTAASGSGTFVASGVAAVSVAGNGAREREPTQLSTRGLAIGPRRGGMPTPGGAFVPGVADASLFPFHVWRRLLARYLTKNRLDLAGYAPDGAGLLSLREAIATYLGVSRSVNCTAAQVIITAGTNQSIDLCARLLTDHGDRVLVESPCHWAFPAIFEAAGVHVDPAAVNDEGLALSDRDFAERIRLVVSSPSHQYPTGAVMPLPRRRELLEIAQRHDSWIIEDDYDSEFRYDGAPLPSLQGLDSDGRVIYMGTLSKAMFAGIRVSYLVVPMHVAAAFSNAAGQIYRPGSLHQQAALAEFIGEGHLSQHIRAMRREYGERQTLLRAAMTQHFGTLWRMSPARAGLHLLATPSAPLSARALVAEAAKDGLIVGLPHFIASRRDTNVTGSDAMAEERPLHDAIVLGYGGVPAHDIEQGVRTLARAVERAMG